MSFMGRLQDELADFKKQGVYKRLNYLDSPQGPRVRMEGRGEVVVEDCRKRVTEMKETVRARGKTKDTIF